MTRDAGRRGSRPPLCVSLVMGALCLGLGACAGAPSRPFVEPAVSRTPEDVLAALHAREARIHNLKGLFQADVRGARLPWSRRIHGTLFYRRPDWIRVTGLTRAGGAVFDFLLRGDTYALRVPERRDAVVGRVAELERLGDASVPIRLSLRAVELLLGKASRLSRSPDTPVEGHTYRYSAPAAFPLSTFPAGRFGGRRHVWVDRDSAHMRAVEYRTVEEETRLALSASDFRPVDDGRAGRDGVREQRPGSGEPSNALVLPFAVTATVPATSESVALAFLELAVNVPLSERAFRVP